MRSNDTWYGKGGIRQRWNPLGHTVFYGEYEHLEQNNVSDVRDLDTNSLLFSGTSDARLWGVGVVQEIDAAAMSVWVKYRNVDASFDAVTGSPGLSTDHFQYVGAGALINF
jgi:hypothetical protein